MAGGWQLARTRPTRSLAALLVLAPLLLTSGAARAETPHLYPPRPRARISSTSLTVPDPTLPTTSQNGAVFISIGNGEGSARCSATSVNAPNRSVVFTAGHCVFDEGRWLDHKWVFVPGYHHGERPFGTFSAKWLGTTPQWLKSANENFDVGAAVVGRNERGQRLADAVGADGIAWGLPPGQVFDVFGYPVASPFNGSTLQQCAGAPYEGHAFFSFLSPGPLNLAVPCNVSPGASGGGWVIKGDVLNGITTNGFPEDQTTDYGPYFGKAVGRLFSRAAGVR